jgi:hypothetical protein
MMRSVQGEAAADNGGLDYQVTSSLTPKEPRPGVQGFIAKDSRSFLLASSACSRFKFRAPLNGLGRDGCDDGASDFVSLVDRRVGSDSDLSG